MNNNKPPTFTLPITEGGYWHARHPDTPKRLTGQLYFRLNTYTESSGKVDRWLSCRFYFDPRVWDVDKFGLIYTNPDFTDNLHKQLKHYGFQHPEGIDYSEQGMQGDCYIDFDVKDDKGLLLDLISTGTPVYSCWPEVNIQKAAA